MIKYQCSNCGQKFKSDEKHAGQKGKCHKCGSIVIVPGASDEKSQDDILSHSMERVTDLNSHSIRNFENSSVDSSKQVACSSNKYLNIILWGLLLIFIVVIITAAVRHNISVEQASKRLHEMAEYSRAGKDYPGENFEKLIPEMKVFMEKMRPIYLELTTIERKWEIGTSYLEYKDSIIKLGLNCDNILDVPDCRPAEKLVRIAKYTLSRHEYALFWFQQELEDKWRYKTNRKEAVEEALKETKEFIDYYQYILEEIDKRS